MVAIVGGVMSDKTYHKGNIKGGHRYQSCKQFSCEVSWSDCKNKHSHNTLLHKIYIGPVAVLSSPAREVVGHNAATPAKRPLLKIIDFNITKPKGSYDSFALRDNGSTVTLIDSSVTTAPGRKCRVRVNGISDVNMESNKDWLRWSRSQMTSRPQMY